MTPSRAAAIAAIVASVGLSAFTPVMAAGPRDTMRPHRMLDFRAGNDGRFQFAQFTCAPKAADRMEHRFDKLADRLKLSDEQKSLYDAFMTSALTAQTDFADKCADARDGLNMPSYEHWNVSTRLPIGPVGVITPWNTPFMLSTWKIAPALAAGCTVVHKPAEWSPVTADLLAKLVKQAGVPDGVLNTVHGIGEEAGKALTEHPAIKAIGFVGESATGSAIMAQGAPTLKRVHFELGGKIPVLVLDFADL